MLNPLHIVCILQYQPVVTLALNQEAGKFQFCGCHSDLSINMQFKICYCTSNAYTVPGTEQEVAQSTFLSEYHKKTKQQQKTFSVSI